MARSWTLDDIPWDRLDAAQVDDDIIKIVRAASLVEYNASDYANYLCSVFHDDPEFQQAAKDWAVEEVQHGKALGEFARRIDPAFDFDERLKVYRERVPIDIHAQDSIRGSRAGELVARCMVEVGTSSFYTAIGQATNDPALQAICKNIATDEWQHYGLFYRYLKKYLEHEDLPRYRRLMVALGRIAETEDDELATAYHTANTPDQPYDRKESLRAYSKRALPLYHPSHVQTAMGMIFKAVGYKPHGLMSRGLTKAVTGYMALRAQRRAEATV
jgi:hypothetical protein